MKKVILIMAALALLATQADASVQYGMGLDGNGVLSIAGAVRASYDSDSHAGNSTTALLDLTGWQDISLVYYNSWGSNYLSLYSVSDGATVPLANMRSQNTQGDWISGLRADYYNYRTNALVKTIYGEGPIEHEQYGMTQLHVTFWA